MGWITIYPDKYDSDRIKKVSRGREKMMKATKDKIQVGTLIDRELYRLAKIQAVTEGRTIGEIIDDGILLYLEKVKKEEGA